MEALIAALKTIEDSDDDQDCMLSALGLIMFSQIPDQDFSFAFGTCEDTRCKWDGTSKRCKCGNNRVAWQWDSKRKQWEAEAY